MRTASGAALVRALAAEHGCAPEALAASGVDVADRLPREGRRRFPLWAPRLVAVTIGAGAVVTCAPEWVSGVRAALGGMERDEVFGAEGVTRLRRLVAPAGMGLGGPQVGHLAAGGAWLERPPPDEYGLRWLDAEGCDALRRMGGFPNALGGRPNAQRPTVLACVAEVGGAVAAVAGCSDDTGTAGGPALWQIGVDVLPAHRGRGVGRAVVAALRAEVERRGAVPYYVALPSNVVSMRLAAGAGFRPCWVEMYARPERA